MKRMLLFTLLFSIAGVPILHATVRDTIITPFYFTILGIGTKNAQVAVIGNIAPNGFTGTQVGGIFNIGTGTISGMQLAGVFNHANDSLTGVQFAGCMNTVHGNVRGLQAAGTLNATDRNVFGLQLAGAANIAAGDVSGAQVAGGINIAAGDVSQLQVSGGMNYARNVRGLQITGGLNVASGTVSGMQISGGMNYARNVKGIQLGVFNFADSVDGAMIGLFSFARHGYHKIELGWNETTPLNFSFLTGGKSFHNIFSLAFDPRPRQPYWGFGYGVGTAFKIHRRVDMNITAVEYHINQGDFSECMSDLFKLSVTFDAHLTKNLSLAAGPSLNIFVSDLHPNYGETTVTGFAPYYFFSQTYNNRWNAKAWAGVNVSIRFL
ncbi:hypothetical protein BH11BAC7_BH11BAC7_07120 [soil metagenome]